MCAGVLELCEDNTYDSFECILLCADIYLPFTSYIAMYTGHPPVGMSMTIYIGPIGHMHDTHTCLIINIIYTLCILMWMCMHMGIQPIFNIYISSLKHSRKMYNLCICLLQVYMVACLLLLMSTVLFI